MDEQKEKDDRPRYDYSKLPQWIEDGDAVAFDDAVKADQGIQFNCARCRDSWSCRVLTGEQRREVTELWRRKTMLDVFAFLRSAGFTFAEAKPTMLHVTKVPGECHKCKRAVPDDSEHVICQCRSLNLNW